MTHAPRYNELMHAEIDGVISTEEGAALREFLAASPAAQEEFDQLRRLSAALAGVGPVEAPPDLKSGILRAIRTRDQRAAGGLPRWIRGMWPGGRAILHYAYAAAAGLVLGAVLFHGWAGRDGDGRGIDPSALVGTMARHESGTEGVLRTIPVGFPGASGTAIVRRAEAGYTIEIELDPAEPLEAVLGFDPGAVAFRGFAQDSQAFSGFEVRDATLAWRQGGRGRLAVLVIPRTRAESTLELRFSSHGKPMSSNKIAVPGQG